jgi:hypothetical protein
MLAAVLDVDDNLQGIVNLQWITRFGVLAGSS